MLTEKSFFSIFLIGGILCLVSACGKKSYQAAEEEVHIKKVQILYTQYAAQHRGQGPSSLNDLKAFVQKMPASERERYGVTDTNLDTLFRSPRDNKEYVIRKAGPSKGGVPGIGGKGPVVVYEQIGDGKGNHYVVYAVGEVAEVDQETFKELVPEAR